MKLEYAKRIDGMYNLWKTHDQIDGDDTSRWEIIGVYNSEEIVYRELERKMIQAGSKKYG